MATTNTTKTRLRRIYKLLLKEYGRQRWWPAKTPFEVCVGAVLTQSTSWKNVEKAVRNLEAAGILTPKSIVESKTNRLAYLIRPSLYYNIKARKLKELSRFIIDRYGGEVENMRKTPLPMMRNQLLSVWGIGPETADSILLYAVDKPVFVVDAYTRRIFHRLHLSPADATYDQLKMMFENTLPRDTKLYNEYHALIVEHGKTRCRIKPLCSGCCLAKICPTA